jgi:hypothetical protein
MAKFLEAIGREYFSPGQSFFRNSIKRGRYGAMPTTRNHTAYNVDCNSDGTVDLIRLEAGFADWQDLGGKGAYDVRAGR